MRQEVLDYIKTLDIGNLAISTDLPFDDSGVPLYLKNVKRVYVDSPTTETETFAQTLGGHSYSNETTSIQIYFAVDAKNILVNYDDIVSTLKTVAEITTINGINRREVDVATEYVNDILVATLDVRLTRIR